MRLLHTLKYTLHEFHGDGIPEYVILSHTWGQGEVTFQDIQDVDKASAKPGFQKIAGTCRKAASDGFEYCWIDTCCIDKSSSAELSEAINSMYSWYKGSRICYAYLSDISRTGTQDADFGKSRWWRRGWTLQELIAPAVVEFYDVNWEELGSKSSIQEAISSLTGIGVQVLLGDNPAECTVAERMSWASKRSTTRIEDRAYSLMGLFNVHLPMLYGEGHKAFARLQEEIMKTTEDYTILAWSRGLPRWAGETFSGVLAHSPSDFGELDLQLVKLDRSIHHYLELKNISEGLFTYIARLSRSDIIELPPPTMTSRGLHIGLLLADDPQTGYTWACVAMLPQGGLCICLESTSKDTGQYRRNLLAGFAVATGGIFANSKKGDEILCHNSREQKIHFKYHSIYAEQTPLRTRKQLLDDMISPMKKVYVTTDHQLQVSRTRHLLIIRERGRLVEENFHLPVTPGGPSDTTQEFHDLCDRNLEDASLQCIMDTERRSPPPSPICPVPGRNKMREDVSAALAVFHIDSPSIDFIVSFGLQNGALWCDIERLEPHKFMALPVRGLPFSINRSSDRARWPRTTKKGQRIVSVSFRRAPRSLFGPGLSRGVERYVLALKVNNPSGSGGAEVKIPKADLVLLDGWNQSDPIRSIAEES